MDLRGGNAGKAILQAAGQDLQTEINAKYKSDIKFGEIAYVSGGKMECKHLYMTCLPGWDQKDLKPTEVRIKTLTKIIILHKLITHSLLSNIYKHWIPNCAKNE